MGKAGKWFRAVLGLKKPNPPPAHSPPTKDKPRSKWPFHRKHNHNPHQPPTQRAVSYEQDSHDPNTHAIAVAAASAAVAEVAVAAAHAAAEVVRLTSNVRCSAKCAGGPPQAAAVKIQAAFRGYLARRALRALKALVRLQAIVRGHIERKRTAEWLQRMQVLLRAQARARAVRIQVSESSLSNSSCKTTCHHPGPPTPEKFEHTIRTKSGKYDQSFMLKRNGSKSNSRTSGDQEKTQSSSNRVERYIEERSWDHQLLSRRAGVAEEVKSDKILEIDTGKFNSNYKRGKHLHPTHHSTTSEQYTYSYSTSKDTITHQTIPSPSSGEVQSPSPLKFSNEIEEPFCTAENSPQFMSASSRGGSGKRSPFTPTKSDGSRSFLSGYSDCPNYMSFTESSKAKVRSVSAPKQRPHYERSSSAKRYSIHGFGEPRSSSAQRASALRTNFVSKAYPGSGRLDSLGMPIGQRYY